MSAIVSPSNIADQNGVFVFPASSSDGIGKLLTEANIRDISGKITTRNYKILSSDFVISEDNQNASLKVTKGTAMINGYRVEIPNDLNVSLVSSDFDISSPTKYDINLKIAKQSSTSGYIADTSETSDYGVIYIEFTPASNSPKTMKEYFENRGINDKYKPSEQRLSSLVDITSASSISTFGNYDGANLETSIDESDYTSLGWLIDKYNALFVSDLGYDDTRVNVLTFNKSESGSVPSLSLTLGYIVLSKSGDNIQIDSYGTYDCTKRIDIDDIFCGDQTLSEYLIDNGRFMKPYGGNIVTSVRIPETGTTGTISEIPYVSTIDSLFTSAIVDEIEKFDKEYMYMPVTYMGETYNEDSNDDITSNTETTKAIIECSFDSVKKETQGSFDEIYGSRILNVAGYKDCYTSYGYNLTQRIYDDTEEGFVSKACKLNKYFVGIKYDDSYLYTEGSSGNKVAPPFGLYVGNPAQASILIEDVIDNGVNKFIDKLLASKVVLSTPTFYNTSNSIYGAFEVDDNDASYNLYKTENNNIVKSSAGFKTFTEGLKSKPAITFTEGEKSTSVYLSETTDTDLNTPVVEFEHNVKVNGYVRASRVYNAVYNDYAEWYNSSNAENIEAGDIIYYNPENDEYDNKYKSSKTVVGICSEDFGYIVGGEDVSPEENRKKFIPVSLCGRVPVKVNDTSEFKAGDFIYANGSNIGTGIGSNRDRVGKFIKAIDNSTALVQVYLG